MLIDVRKAAGQPCAILGYGHTVLDDRVRYDNQQFIQAGLSQAGQRQLWRDLSKGMPIALGELLRRADQKFFEATGIKSRYIFAGSMAELGTLAVTMCLGDAGVAPGEIDAIIVGTNTSDSYIIANDIKKLIGAPTQAFVTDTQAACPVGATIVQLGWHLVRSGCFRRVLVVGVEKATTLASKDDYRSANLFGDAAFAFLLGPADQPDSAEARLRPGKDQFLFFDCGSDPSNRQDQYIRRTHEGFEQDGRAVHKYVGKDVPPLLDDIFNKLQLDPAKVDHIFPHQPSARTVQFFLENLQRCWPTFLAQVHGNIEGMGNTSGACTGWMISRAKHAGQLRPGQFCLVASFGAGMSYGFYGFVVR